MATATMRDGSGTAPSSTGSSRAISWIGTGARDGSHGRRGSRILAGNARRSGALSGPSRDRYAAAQEHAVRDPVRRAAHESWTLPAVRLSEHPDRDGTVSRDLLSTQVPERPRDHPAGNGQPPAKPVHHLLSCRAGATQRRYAVR